MAVVIIILLGILFAPTYTFAYFLFQFEYPILGCIAIILGTIRGLVKLGNLGD